MSNIGDWNGNIVKVGVGCGISKFLVKMVILSKLRTKRNYNIIKVGGQLRYVKVEG